LKFIDGVNGLIHIVQGMYEKLYTELPAQENDTKIYLWEDGTNKINVYDTISKKKETFNVNISFPKEADGIKL